jgi:hypothetical protein
MLGWESLTEDMTFPLNIFELLIFDPNKLEALLLNMFEFGPKPN